MSATLDEVKTLLAAEQFAAASKKLPSVESALSSDISSARNALRDLDVRAHTLLGMSILKVIASNDPQTNKNQLLSSFSLLFLLGDERQLLQSQRSLASLAAKFMKLPTTPEQCNLAAPGLKKCVELLRPSDNVLTNHHVAFVRVCITGQAYQVAAELISTPIYRVKTEEMVPHDVFLYYYLGGIVFTAQKRYVEACAFFKTCITLPAERLTGAAVAAYKKWMLVSLIVDGKKPTLPVYTPTVVERQVDACVEPYTEFANAFTSGLSEGASALQSLRKLHTANATGFIKDVNNGLVKQCIEHFIQRKIKMLTNTYVVIPLKDIAQRIGVQDEAQVEAYVVSMVRANELRASIDQRTGMVRFFETGEHQDDSKLLAELENQVRHVLELCSQIENVDRTVSVSEEFVRRTMSKSDQQEMASSGMEVDVSYGGFDLM